ncbi:unnamed protein product [Rotaria socialis]|nr:unnamed protein product [Rotaria socialis]
MSITRKRCLVQTYLLVWLDNKINEFYVSHVDLVAELQRIISSIKTFISPDECIDFLTKIDNTRVFIIVSDEFGEQLVSKIHNISQINAIYVFGQGRFGHERSTKDWPKVKGIFKEFRAIVKLLKQIVRQSDQDSISIHRTSTMNDTSYLIRDELDQSFMYTQIFKEILLNITFNDKSVNELAEYCRQVSTDNNYALANIAKFENEYHLRSPIWWYTYGSFLYSMVNYALRTQETEAMIKMGFFIVDLHRSIEKLHLEQFSKYHEQSFTVYRGQGMSRSYFSKLKQIKSGLMSFNNFLSTTTKKDVSMAFAESALGNPDLVAVIFVIEIDTTIPSTPFAIIDSCSYYETEHEILFSMHTIFRIDEIKQSNINNQVWIVKLILTSGNDKELESLTERMRAETEGLTGWHRLGKLLVKLGEIKKAEELYTALLDQTDDEEDKSVFYYELGRLKAHESDYSSALSLYERALELRQKTVPEKPMDLAQCYSDIGLIYSRQKEYSKALSYHEKALEIRQKILPSNDLVLAISYNSLSLLYEDIGKYSEALLYLSKSLEIRQEALPSTHPDIGNSYYNFSCVYSKLGDYSKALEYQLKAHGIYNRTLPPHHPNLAQSYTTMASVYYNMGEYSKALEYSERGMNIIAKSLPASHPDLSATRMVISEIRSKMDKYM